MEFKDYYQTMDVAESASSKDIKSAYRKLARKYHPDVSKETDAEDRFKELGEAYEVLKDPEKRAQYDQLRTMGAQQGDGSFRPPPGWQPHTQSHSAEGVNSADFSDFFESIFGHARSTQHSHASGTRQSVHRRGEDVHAKLALLLEEAAAGCEKQLSFRVAEADQHGLPRQRNKTLKVKIPAGISQGQHIRLQGQGGSGIGNGQNGDLFIEVELAPHPLYSVNGKDIYLTLPVTPWEAALGASVTAPTLGGEINIKIPKGASSGQKLRLKGKGLAGKSPGDQLVILQIVLPTEHSLGAEKLYSELAELEHGFKPRAKLAAKTSSKVSS